VNPNSVKATLSLGNGAKSDRDPNCPSPNAGAPPAAAAAATSVSQKFPELKVHPAAALLPMLDTDRLMVLAQSIKENGLLYPIVLDKENQILDGRNRYAACKLVQVEPRFDTYAGDPIPLH
jgi:hypothetical protein